MLGVQRADRKVAGLAARMVACWVVKKAVQLAVRLAVLLVD